MSYSNYCKCQNTYTPKQTNTIKYLAQYAKQVVKHELKKHKDQRNCAVFDIDETVIQSTCMICKEDLKDPKIIKPMYNLVHLLFKNGVDIYFVTARSDTPGARKYTVNQLKEFNLDVYKKLYMKGMKQPEDKDIGIIKKEARQDITENGYNIILSVGDQETDMEGGFFKESIKMPNSVYEVR
tara:strand:- start:1373 stop:1918 length:546 start_codon:yes stop_codon:yes gene_type:complete